MQQLKQKNRILQLRRKNGYLKSNILTLKLLNEKGVRRTLTA